jgi:hypothetical protein
VFTRVRHSADAATRAARRALVAATALLTTTSIVRAETVQVPIDALLNGRPVSTLTGGDVVPWTPGQGVDSSDGLVTNAVETFFNQTGSALPDDGQFAADSDHPEVALHFSNSAPATSFQAHYLNGAGSFQFALPGATYSKLFLFMTSSYGASPLTVSMIYADGTSSLAAFTLPDWGTGQPLPTSPPIFFNLASGMHKWNAQDQEVDSPVHTITGVVLAPAALKELVSVQVNKPNSEEDLIFWGATGIASSLDDAGAVVDDASGPADASEADDDAATAEARDAPFDASGEGGEAATSSGSGDEGGVTAVAIGEGPDAASALDGSSAPGAPAASAPPSGKGCSLSASSTVDAAPWGWMLVLCGASICVRRRAC